MLKQRNLSIFPLFLVSIFLIFPVNCENITFSLDSAESTQLLNKLISTALQQLNVQVPIDPIRVNISADNGQYGVQLQLTVNGNLIVSKSETPTDDDGGEVEENTLERENAFGVYTFPGTEMAGLEAYTTTDLVCIFTFFRLKITHFNTSLTLHQAPVLKPSNHLLNKRGSI